MSKRSYVDESIEQLLKHINNERQRYRISPLRGTTRDRYYTVEFIQIGSSSWTTKNSRVFHIETLFVEEQAYQAYKKIEDAFLEFHNEVVCYEQWETCQAKWRKRFE